MPHMTIAVPNRGRFLTQKRLWKRPASVLLMPGPLDADARWGDPFTVGEPSIEHVLAAYGTLQPGESNFDVMRDVEGLWFPGLLRGRRFINPGGQYRGFPAFESIPAADPTVAVSVLVSSELPAHWARLDEFEGPGYRRVPILVDLGGGSATDDADPIIVRAYVYEIVPHPA